MKKRDFKDMATMDREETFGIKIRMRASNMGKRIMDLVGSALLLIFLSPVFGIVAIYIKRSSPGPVFLSGATGGQVRQSCSIS